MPPVVRATLLVASLKFWGFSVVLAKCLSAKGGGGGIGAISKAVEGVCKMAQGGHCQVVPPLGNKSGRFGYATFSNSICFQMLRSALQQWLKTREQ